MMVYLPAGKCAMVTVKFVAVDFLAKRRRIVGGAFDGDGRIVLAMRKVAADAHLLAAGSADFVVRQGMEPDHGLDGTKIIASAGIFKASNLSAPARNGIGSRQLWIVSRSIAV